MEDNTEIKVKFARKMITYRADECVCVRQNFEKCCVFEDKDYHNGLQKQFWTLFISCYVYMLSFIFDASVVVFTLVSTVVIKKYY
jgi:hypothetical protein